MSIAFAALTMLLVVTCVMLFGWTFVFWFIGTRWSYSYARRFALYGVIVLYLLVVSRLLEAPYGLISCMGMVVVWILTFLELRDAHEGR